MCVILWFWALPLHKQIVLSLDRFEDLLWAQNSAHNES